jgi:hypothetical protein
MLPVSGFFIFPVAVPEVLAHLSSRIGHPPPAMGVAAPLHGYSPDGSRPESWAGPSSVERPDLPSPSLRAFGSVTFGNYLLDASANISAIESEDLAQSVPRITMAPLFNYAPYLHKKYNAQ